LRRRRRRDRFGRWRRRGDLRLWRRRNFGRRRRRRLGRRRFRDFGLRRFDRFGGRGAGDVRRVADRFDRFGVVLDGRRRLGRGDGRLTQRLFEIRRVDDGYGDRVDLQRLRRDVEAEEQTDRDRAEMKRDRTQPGQNAGAGRRRGNRREPDQPPRTTFGRGAQRAGRGGSATSATFS